MLKVLVIDDERPTLSMFKLFLGAYGYDVLTAETGEDGLEAFKANSPPIVITDIKMPGMDGIEVLKRVKELAPLTEVIIITGHGDMDLAIKALNLDATDFINKPIQKKDLENALKRANERIELAKNKSEDVRLSEEEGVSVIHIQGNVTSRSEPYLSEAFESAKASEKGVVLSFAENASINGAGIALLTQLLLDCQKRNQSAAITGLSDNFRKVFEIVGINKLAVLRESEEEAVKGF